VSPSGIGDQVTYGSRFFTPKQGDTLAKVRAEDLRAQAKTFHGSGPVIGITSGYTFQIEGHPRAQLNTEYLAVTVDHFGFISTHGWGKAIPHEYNETYRVDLTAIEADQQYRHPETAVWPRLDGYENAVVDGPATSEYAQIDAQGRYNVKFKFDEGTLKGGKASTWVRKMQPHAGTVEGWHFPERAGTEVICAFLGGDPDRPIIIGAVPTAVHPSPVSSANHTQNVIQTGGKNRFEMEDLAGQQRVTISTPHSRSFVSLGHPLSGTGQVYSGEKEVPDHQVTIFTDGCHLLSSGSTSDFNIGEDWNVWVTSNHVEWIGQNVNHWVGGNVEQEIIGTLLQEVQGGVTEAYHSTLTQGVQAAVDITHNATFKHTVEGTVTEEFGPTTTTIKGTHTLTVEGAQNIEVKANLGFHVDGFWNHAVEGPKSETIGGATQNVFLGLKSEFIGGIHINTIVGVDTNIFGAFRFLIGPEENHLFAAKVDVEGELSKLQGEVNGLKGMEADLKGLHNDVSGLQNTTNGLTSRTAGLERKMHGVQQQVTALHSMVNGLTSVL
jgi:type VI secretion system secreted protein VgrG